ncbi:AAA family ATPase [Modicisalibacter coralii]|uniref:AAA family ATPase n=1 Tax=Modicisalibacter coralii TaxID=2304602 RepID=UPI00100B1952|nr:AAA family ATPase [Halomonas coralii]
MRIESIRICNFKGFQNTAMTDIPRFCVIVGANGSGKSTLFDVFGFLKDCLTYNVRHALQARGGFKEVLSRGANADDCISFEIKFRMEIAGIERLITYLLEIGLDARQPTVKREVLRYKRGRYGSPYHFLDFEGGSGYAIINEEDFDKQNEQLEREQQNVGKDVLAIKGLGQFERFRAASAFRQLIENWHVSDFHINLARGSKESIGDFEHLSVSGDNLQLVARNIYENYSEIFQQIVEAMKHRVPGVRDVEPVLMQDGRLILNFQDGSFRDPFIDRYVSDGTIKMFAYLVLLYDPEPHPLLCIEEPENQLYPTLLWELAEEFRGYAERGGQVFVSTHSPDFLNAVQVDEIYWLIKEQGCTQIRRASEDAQLVAFADEGDQMGYLWKEGLFGGADPQ